MHSQSQQSHLLAILVNQWRYSITPDVVIATLAIFVTLAIIVMLAIIVTVAVIVTLQLL